MATKKPKTGSRTRSKRHRAAEPAPFSTPAPVPKAGLGAPTLGVALDPEDARVRGPQAAQTEAERRAQSAQGRSAGQAGALQGLSDAALAAPESVDELLEEGNTFEAEAVAGVEDAPDADQGEVKTREFPEDDVPEEYLDNDR